MKIVSEATREELEAALAALDDPHKKFKDALKEGKRVRVKGWQWYSSETKFNWEYPPEMYEIEPEYCGYTEEQWQFVIDGKFDVKVSNLNASKTSERPYITLLTGLSPIQEDKFIIKDGSPRYCHIVRRKNHPQPAFGRSVEDNDWVLVHYKSGGRSLILASDVTWDSVDWFINFSNEG